MKTIPLLRVVFLGVAMSGVSVAVHAMGDKPAKEQTTTATQDIPPPPPPQKPDAAPGKGSTPATPAGETYTWHDGTRTHTLFLSPNTIAEFGVPANDNATPLKRAVPAAQALKRAGGAQLWRLGSGTNATAAIRDALAKQPTAKVSPVFTDRAGAGRMRALPGNVIVYLPPDWNEAAVQAWAQQQGVVIDRKLDIGKNAYVIKTAPGLPALETANRLHASGEVVRAFPDWWQETSTR